MDTRGISTVSLALAVPPVPLSVDVILPVTLVQEPTVLPVIVTETAHVPLAGILPLAKAIERKSAATVTVPPQEVVAEFEFATIIPAGRGSVKATPPRYHEFGLPRVKVSVVLAPNAIVLAPNALTIVGGDVTGVLTGTKARPVTTPAGPRAFGGCVPMLATCPLASTPKAAMLWLVEFAANKKLPVSLSARTRGPTPPEGNGEPETAVSVVSAPLPPTW
jgi:hypothetical protein